MKLDAGYYLCAVEHTTYGDTDKSVREQGECAQDLICATVPSYAHK